MFGRHQMAVSISLTPHCCGRPGSHKSNWRPPPGIFAQKNDFESELKFPVHNPPAKAGDLVIVSTVALHELCECLAAQFVKRMLRVIAFCRVA